MPPMPPGGDFILHEEIGVGGLSRVYRGWQAALERDVAVKVPRDDVTNPALTASMMLEEARITARLEHPGIPSIHDLRWDSSGRPMLAMRRIHGQAWSRCASTMNRRENAGVVMRVAQVVAYAHQQGVLHRDLKPGNVMLGDFGEVLLLDWGMALSVHDIDRRSDRWLGNPCGTPQFMAPEAAHGHRPSFATDIYGLGGLLWFAIHGRPPHDHGDPAEALRLAREIAVASPLDPSADDLLAVALRALSRSAAARHASVQEFIDALEQAFSREEARRLLLDAEEDLKGADTEGYAAYQRALFRLRESLRIWPENMQTQLRISSAAQAYARTAFEREDFDLATSLLEPEDDNHRQLLASIRHRRRRRELEHRDAERHAKRLLHEQERTQFLQAMLLDTLRESSYERQGPGVSLLDALTHAMTVAQQAFPADAIHRAYVRQAILNSLQGKQFQALRRPHVDLLLEDVRAAGLSDHHEIARAARYEQAALLRDEERFHDALPLAEECLRACLTHEPDIKEEHSVAYDLFMECALSSGNISAAREVVERVIIPAVRDQPMESSWRQHIEAHLFGYLVRIGSLAEAERMGKDLLQRARLGSLNNPKDILQPTMNMFFLFMDQGRWDEALPYIEEVCTLRQTLFGATAPATLAAYGLLGAVHLGRDDLASAADLLEDSLADLRTAAHLEPRDYFEPLLRVARLQQRRGQLDETETLLAEAATILPTCPTEARVWLGPLCQLVESWCQWSRGNYAGAVANSWRAMLNLEGQLGVGDGRGRRARVAWSWQWQQWHAMDATAADEWLRDSGNAEQAARAHADGERYPGLVSA